MISMRSVNKYSSIRDRIEREANDETSMVLGYLIEISTNPIQLCNMLQKIYPEIMLTYADASGLVAKVFYEAIRDDQLGGKYEATMGSMPDRTDLEREVQEIILGLIDECAS